MCAGSAWRGKKLFMENDVRYISIETVVYACKFSSNWKIFFQILGWTSPNLETD